MSTAEDDSEGGRLFFSGAERSLVEEDEIELTSVGVDIGSSTSHLLFSKITLERLDSKYVVAARETLHESDILLTPYTNDNEIDTQLLSEFVDQAYDNAGLQSADVDTGALILTGVALRRKNARAIGELFVSNAGKFVALSAGDRLEAVLAAHGSGAAAASRNGRTIANIDVGGGTTKISVCKAGKVFALTAVEAGARLVVTDAAETVVRIEDYGQRYADALNLPLSTGDTLDQNTKRRLAKRLSEVIVDAVRGVADSCWLRLDSLHTDLPIDGVLFSGGVSEFIYGRSKAEFFDLGSELASALLESLRCSGIALLTPENFGSWSRGIRATVAGASQYTVQLSGSTVYLDPPGAVPVNNVATIQPRLDLGEDELDANIIAEEIKVALQRIDFSVNRCAVAVALHWQGSATYQRLDALSRGLTTGLDPVLQEGHPMIVVTDGDIGGLLGMHCRENKLLDNSIVSIDGIELNELDFIDIGEVLLSTGAVPVVVKSLVFPNSGESGDKTGVRANGDVAA
ncbi:MAG: ethanolamine ammonia-lyase reactivating factor EutA [Gammaproteobacteria bacterium]|nr:ethanolamine ammonia-lyase reactivating factor EutA [Gammaproteobacteria bacterium]